MTPPTRVPRPGSQSNDAQRPRSHRRTPLAVVVGDVRGAASSFLNEPAAERLYHEGRGMEVQDAVAYALEAEGT